MIKEVLYQIIYKIDLIRYKYNKDPDEIILGVEIFDKIKGYFYCEYYYQNKFMDLVIKSYRDENKYMLYGIPIVVDYNNPMNVAICIHEKIDVEE